MRLWKHPSPRPSPREERGEGAQAECQDGLSEIAGDAVLFPIVVAGGLGALAAELLRPRRRLAVDLSAARGRFGQRALGFRGELLHQCSVAQVRPASVSATRGITNLAKVGITSRLQIGDSSMPPTMTQAKGCCTCAPMPVEIAAGTSPMHADRPVMKICRMRVSPARTMASSRGRPSSKFLRM